VVRIAPLCLVDDPGHDLGGVLDQPTPRLADNR
jgi:hypothetical protein